MIKRLVLLMAFVPLAFADILTTPSTPGAPVCLSPALGTAACSIGDQYDSGGLVFSDGVGTATFRDEIDGVFAWGGINAAGNVDLLTPVDVQIVLPGTTTQGMTSFISVEAGFAAAGNLLLSVYDGSGDLLATRVNGLDGVGPDNRTLITISVPGIEFFTVSTPALDSFGVDQITIGDVSTVPPGGGVPDGTPAVPEPASVLLFGTCLLSLAPTLWRRIRRRHTGAMST